MPPKTARRTNTGRLYTINGRQYWSVTTIIGSGLPKPAIAGWQAKTIAEYAVANHRQIAGMLGAVRIVIDSKKPDKPIQVVSDPAAVKAAVDWLKGAPWRESSPKMDLGSAVHAEAEAYILGRPRPKPLPLVAPYIESFEHFLEDFAPTYYQTPSAYLMTEATVYSPREVYAGTLDAIIEIGAHPILIDYKTGSGIYPDVALQLSAYANAELVLLPDGTSEPMPKVAGAAALHLQPYDPDVPEVRGYELIPVDIGPKVFASFKYVREVMRFQEEISKGVLSQPITNPAALAFLYGAPDETTLVDAMCAEREAVA
jgi:hypothetical protein